MSTQREKTTEEVVQSGVESDETIESGEITATQAREPVSREIETEKKFTARDPLKPEPIAVRNKPAPTEVLDGKLTNTLSNESDEKKVDVLVNSYTKCFIGGTWYEFKAGHKYRITQTVKERLKSRGVLEVA